MTRTNAKTSSARSERKNPRDVTNENATHRQTQKKEREDRRATVRERDGTATKPRVARKRPETATQHIGKREKRARRSSREGARARRNETASRPRTKTPGKPRTRSRRRMRCEDVARSRNRVENVAESVASARKVSRVCGKRAGDVADRRKRRDAPKNAGNRAKTRNFAAPPRGRSRNHLVTSRRLRRRFRGRFRRRDRPRSARDASRRVPDRKRRRRRRRAPEKRRREKTPTSRAGQNGGGDTVAPLRTTHPGRVSVGAALEGWW